MHRRLAVDLPLQGEEHVAAAQRTGYLWYMDRRHYPTRKLHLGDPEAGRSWHVLSPGERMAMVWPLTLQAWAFKEDLRDEPRLRRDVGRVVRRGR